MSEGRHVYWVQLTAGGGEEAKAFGLAFECAHASAAAVGARLQSDGVVSGSKLELVDDGRGGRMIRRRFGFAFGLAGFVSVQDYSRPVWEPED